MKLFLSFFLLFGSLAHADITDSLWFEPSLACAVVGAGLYAGAPQGQEVQQGAIGCAVGAGVFALVNYYYSTKIGRVREQEVSDLKKQIKLMNEMQAQRIMKGDPSVEFSLKVRECSGAQELPNGSIQSPVCTDALVIPKSAPEVGY